MKWIVEKSLGLKLFVAVAAAIMFLGFTQLRHAKTDTLPEFGPPTVVVQTEALGLSAPEVEQLITVPLEQDLLDGVAWIAAIHSQSLPGLSWVEMVFQPGTDPLRARQLVQERITQAAGLPNVSATPQMLQPVSSTSRVMMVGLSSTKLSLIQMSVLARWTIRPKLLEVPGVAAVSVWGQRDQQIQVLVDPATLARRKVSLQQVIDTSGNALWASPLTFLEANTPGTGGFVDSANQRLTVQHLQPITTAADLAKIPIEDQTQLRLGDVATLAQGHQPLIGDAVLDGGSGLLVVIQKVPGANTLRVTQGIEAALASLRPGLKGITIDSSAYRPATFVEQSIHNLTIALLVGFVLFVLALVAFFLDWKTTLITVVGVLVSMLAAGLVLYLRGVTFNAVVLAGLVMALGAVIDDSVAGVHNVASRLREDRLNGRKTPAAHIILDASLEVRRPLLYATLIMLVAVVPLWFLGPTAFFRPLVVSYALAVVVSLAVALTVVPALSLLLLSRAAGRSRVTPVARRMHDLYDGALARIVRAPVGMYVAIGIVVVAGVAVTPFLGRSGHSLVPPFKDSALLVQMNAASGTSLPEMQRIVARTSDELRATPGVKNVGANVGRAFNSDQVVAVDAAELWINVDPAADYDRTLASVTRVIDGYPGIASRILTYPSESIQSVLANTHDPIVVRVFGPDMSVLQSKAEEIRKAMAGIRGVVDPHVQSQTMVPTIDVEPDLAAAKRYGIKPGDVRRAAATLVEGITVGGLFEQEKIFDVVVWGAPADRASLTSVRNLLIDTPGGGHVRLGAVASVSVRPTPTVIRHEEISRSLDVSAQVRGRDAGAVAKDVSNRLASIAFPLEHHAELIGAGSIDQAGTTSEAQITGQAPMGRMIAVAAAVAIGLFLLLQLAFGSWRLAALLFLTLSMALAGGALAAFADGRVVSIGSLAGFVVVAGISARGALALIERYRHLERHEGEPFGSDMVLRGSRERLVPTLMTVVGTGFVFLPLAVIGGVAGEEIVHPMAVVVLGGLVVSLILDVFALPALYLRLGVSAARAVSVFEEAPAPSAAALPASGAMRKSSES